MLAEWVNPSAGKQANPTELIQINRLVELDRA